MGLFIKIFLVIFLTSTICYADNWVCFDPITKNITKTVQGDGYAFGLCGLNNKNIDPNCISATKEEYILAQQPYHRYDPGVVTGNRIVSFPKAEIDTIILDEQNSAIQSNRDTAKSIYDNETYLKALIKIFVNEFNKNLKLHGEPEIIEEDMINAIKAEINSGGSD